MKRARRVQATMTIERPDGEHTVQIAADMVPGDPGCRTMRNGDPGWPPSPPEINDLEAWTTGRRFELTDSEIDQATERLIEEFDLYE